MTEAHELIPSAKRLIKSLRDIGYDFSTAVADLVDNSIEAGATRIDILVEFDGDKSFVRISDNGKGMTVDELKEAMRYGSERAYNKEDLGKFGLGLKTASMSQCQCFYVASRTMEEINFIPAFCWDLAHIEKTNKWEIIEPKEKQILSLLRDPLNEHKGTVVLWQRVDRMLGFKHPYGEPARKKLISMCRELEGYLAMVFHKFLAHETSREPLEIYLNFNKIEPWDPFARNESETKELTHHKVKLIHEGARGKILLQPYILPTKEEFSSPDSFRHASGPKNWNQQQGFYIYRANRMIQSGGWCGIRTRDEHTKLSRIELNFSPVFDNAFKINVAKMSVQLPVQIKEDIEKVIMPAVRLAREHYDGKKKLSSKPSVQSKCTTQAPETDKKESGSNPDKSESSKSFGTSYGIEPPKFLFEEMEEKAIEVATETEKPIIKQVFQRLRKSLFGERL
ncbi:MAG: ATP-binding protein [Nanoarchaeota archaeon]|nr:ATP-binding protein [Nanoarchaeota archaeon]